jgi:hypothetical protein
MSPALWVQNSMITENISRSGLLVVWSGEGTNIPVPGVGQIITVEIELPANHGFGQKCIHCQGTVTRVTGVPETPKVALRVNYMDFRAFHDRLRVVEASTPVANSWMA